MQRQNFERVIRAAIVKHEAVTGPGRERVYDAARSSLRRRPGNTQEDMAELEAAIAAVEATFAAEPTPPRPAGLLKALRVPAAALLAGIALGAGAAFYLHSGTASGMAGPDDKAMEKVRQAYDDNVGHMPEAMKFIRRVVDAVVERQKKDKASLEENAKKFVPLAKFDPELAKRMPKSLPPGTGIMLRADATNLKVLMNWTLCGVASITNPEMVDRKRNPQPSIGCPFFGLWTNGAADW